MARAPKNLATGTIDNTTIKELYEVPVDTVTSPELVLTNMSASPVDVDVTINDGSEDFLLVTARLVGGIGKRHRVPSISDVKLNQLFAVKIQLSAATPINFFLSGTEIATT